MVLNRHREEHPRPVAAIRLPTLTGARLSEVINLKWGEIGELGKHDASARMAMSLSLLKFVGQASLVDEAMLPS